MSKAIPLYACDGGLVGRVSQQRIAKLEGLGLARVVRRRKGDIARAVMRQRPGDPTPTKLTDYLGTRYSFREHLNDGHLCWRMKRLGHGDELRPIFLRVLTDCLAAGA